MRWEIEKSSIRVLAPAKVNLYLEVGRRRDDGFHEIDSIFQAVSLFDELELRPQEGGLLTLEEEGISAGADNLVLRAARRLQEHAVALGREPQGARMRLKKRIPQGAGLGGGSSDAAAALLALDRMWDLRTPRTALERLALAVGSDVPFFLVGGTARCQGRGERVTSLSGAFDGREPLCFVLAYPRFAVSTREVYAALDASRGRDARESDFALTPSSPLDSMSPASMRDRFGCGELFFNRLERVVYAEYPALRSLRSLMLAKPFAGVLLSGSGSTVYGVCAGAADAERLAEELSAETDADIYAVRAEGERESPWTRVVGGG